MVDVSFSHIQMLRYEVQIGDRVTNKVALFNCNKLPTGVAIKCIETDTFNPYLLTMTEEHFKSLFLDDGDIAVESDNDEINKENDDEN